MLIKAAPYKLINKLINCAHGCRGVTAGQPDEEWKAQRSASPRWSRLICQWLCADLFTLGLNATPQIFNPSTMHSHPSSDACDFQTSVWNEDISWLCFATTKFTSAWRNSRENPAKRKFKAALVMDSTQQVSANRSELAIFKVIWGAFNFAFNGTSLFIHIDECICTR